VQVDRVRTEPWLSLRELATEFGVTAAAIWNIRHGRTYKDCGLTKTYIVRITDNQERYSLGSFTTPEGAQAAIDTFNRINPWPRGSVEKSKGRYRARLSLGTYDTRWAAERVNFRALSILRAADPDER
jgi:hypothetical protein